MSYFRYGITLICLFIFIDYSSLVLAQSIYDFLKNNKKTNNNTSTYLERRNNINSSWFSSDSSPQKSGDSNGIKNKDSTSQYLERQNKFNSSSQISKDLKGKYSSSNMLNPKIRFRLLSGIYTSGTQKASSSTSSIIWYDLGIGQSIFKYKASILGNAYEIEATLIEFSYTFGDEFTLTLGGRSVTNGKLTITSNDNEFFESKDVEGSGYFGILGIEFGIFEILAGYQYTSHVYTGIETESTSAFWGSFKDSGGLYVTGIGLAF